MPFDHRTPARTRPRTRALASDAVPAGEGRPFMDRATQTPVVRSVAFVVNGGLDAVKRALPELRLAHRAADLGAVETTVAPPATGSHVQRTAGDLIADLDAALAHA